MAILAVTNVPVATGVTVATVPAASGGDEAPTGPGRFLYVKNASAGSVTVTVVTPGTVSGLAIADASLVVAAGASGIIPLANIFANALGRAPITYSAVTSVTVGVFELAR